MVRFPEITFVSRQVHLSVNGRLSGGARVSGDLTLRGVTRPISLQAALHRPVGSSKTDLDHLTFRLTGQLSRAAFGASGFASLVHDTVDLNILAQLHRAS